jgi:hypothetical protein
MGLNDRFRKEWKLAGYPRGNGSAAVVPPPSKGFKRLYYLTTAEHAVSNVVFGRVKISRFSELNDPFELIGTNFGNKTTRDAVRTYKADLDKECGLICFSEDWTEPVIWSHYAAKHGGIALGFDVDQSIAQQVSYKTSRLKATLPKGAAKITPPIRNILICTKFESWKYEREWRILTPLEDGEKEGSLYFLPFSKTLRLVEMILGPACNLNLLKLRKLINEHHRDVTTFKARLAYRSFRIIAQGNTVPTIQER